MKGNYLSSLKLCNWLYIESAGLLQRQIRYADFVSKAAW